MEDNDFYGREKIAKILFKIAPPVMLAQLIQALYNIVDSLFVGRYSESGLTAPVYYLSHPAADDCTGRWNRCGN